MVQPNQAGATNHVHLHNAVQVRTEARGDSNNKNIAPFKEYAEPMKIQTWINLLELQLKRNVHPSEWAESTISSLNHKLLEKIGAFAQSCMN